MILEKTIKIIPYNGFERLRQLGYMPKYGEEMNIKVEDLPRRSTYKITAICDEQGCNNSKKISYASYCMTVEKNGFYRCFECGKIEKKRVFLEKYGVDNPMKTKEIQEKVSQTTIERYGYNRIFHSENFQEIKKEACLKKYGVEHQLQSSEIQNKLKQTNLERYGVEQVLQSKEIQEKVKQTCLERYGVENAGSSASIRAKCEATCLEKYGVKNPFGSSEIQKKITQTIFERYGVSNPFESPEIQHKIKETLYINNSQYVSQQQQYLCNLYHGLLNYPILMYNADILLDNIDIEYDGGGHDLQIKYGSITKEEFLHREIIRSRRVKQQGYKLMRIISHKDFLPSDEILLKMLSEARQYFEDYPNHSWIEYQIDEGVMRNAEYKEGANYFYGELRKISIKQNNNDNLEG